MAIVKKNLIALLLLMPIFSFLRADEFFMTDTIESGDIHTAVAKGEYDSVKTMLEKDRELVDARNRYGWTPLHMAAYSGRAKIAGLLVQFGADPNARDGWKLTPLHRAVLGRQKEMIEVLVSLGADLEMTDNDGDTALFKAVSLGWGESDFEMTRTLIAAGADFKRKASHGETLLHRTAESGDAEIIRFLISRGIDVNACYRGELTPLHITAAYGHLEATRALIECGADINRTSKFCGTPLHQAEAGKHRETVSLLLAEGAKQVPRKFPELNEINSQKKHPPMNPEPYLPGLFNNVFRWTSTPVFSSDGNEAYWSAGAPHDYQNRIWVMKKENGKRQPPGLVSFSGPYADAAPALSDDGNRLVFHSTRPLPGETDAAKMPHLWMAERENGEWGEPRILKLSQGMDRPALYPFLDEKDHCYFQGNGFPGGIGSGDLFRIALNEKEPFVPVNLGDAVNSPYAESSPSFPSDGNRLVFMSNRPEGFNGAEHDIYVSFRNGDGLWSRALNLGPETSMVRNPRISRDGRSILFSRGDDLFWVGTEKIERMKRGMNENEK